MDAARLSAALLLVALTSGCATSRHSHHDDDSADFSPLIGLIGLAVDGDDKDDYDHFFDDDDCRCHH